MSNSDRKKLNKLIGKRTVYTATVLRVNDTTVLLDDIEHKGKKVADHVWISKVNFDFKYKDEIQFSAIAETYRDSHGARKTGLGHVRRIAYQLDEQSIEIKKNDKQAFKRHKK